MDVGPKKGQGPRSSRLGLVFIGMRRLKDEVFEL
ncbi:unnamed protein product [Rhodiola kirilowii]